MRPRLLEPYCCEGGGAVGYYRAGWDVYGIDLFEHKDAKGKQVGFSQTRYPFASFKGDALVVLRRLLAGDAIPFTHPDGTIERLTLADFDGIHASPPCQHASAGTRAMRAQGRSKHPALIEPTRELLIQTGLPYVIENVKGAALRNPLWLCGCMFDLTAIDADGLPLRLERPRGFESNVFLSAPRACYHDPNVWVAGSYGGGRRAKRKPGETLAEIAPRDRHEARYVRHGGYVPRSKAVQSALLGGVDWMTLRGMAQCLPPAYTQHIGSQLIEHLQRKAA